MILVPQFEMQPFSPGPPRVPSLPVGARVSVQNSDVVPHCPHMLQQALSGHGFRPGHFVGSVGFCVPFICRPHTC